MVILPILVLLPAENRAANLMVASDMKERTIKIFAADGMSTVDAGDRIYSIDYRNGLFSHRAEGQQGCISADLSLKNIKDPYLADRIALFSELQTAERNEGNNSVRLIMGPRPLMLKTVTTPKVVWADLEFTPHITDMYLDPAHELGQELVKIAAANNRLAGRVRLLDLVDTVMLVDQLGGVVKSRKEGDTRYIYSYSLLSYESQKKEMLLRCGDPLQAGKR